ncbi:MULTISPECIES: carbonic anhydrase [Marichromatium]|uniref:carbonic anhydrase n=1 Tax=Marichromatium gracile TaxID=1048 RepID=A0A4R4AMC4_MARGR|nr:MULTISPECIES: carbonic anhydrase [Marichromatium]MBO8087058.1 carbonic anhydrase [Marichromatium sp.]KXX64942.1 carbonic anhydrase [Marichromatium gracile]MBK1708758.1 carbonic anhydrase [Marichromatium gracile]RNE89058.1 carbonic anhydrase [Marichromatium sp. AB31]RNE89547.1 carbonic anhydrase [Marichromatium sp. AB32]
MTNKISAVDALRRLRDGNRRFAAELRASNNAITHADFAGLLSGQSPFAIVLGCSDSRVPAELVFDQGFGDLFVIRVAGNIVAPSQVGSVEFAASRYDTKLVVVLGHSCCGAISATLETMLDGADSESRNVAAIVDRVKPSIEGLLETELREDREALRHAAVRANVRASVDHLRHGSAILESLIEREGLMVVGAEYSLETGLVDFFDGVPEGWDQE